jgi:hypothetical protein
MKTFAQINLAATLLIVAITACQTQAAEKKTHLIILSGQSNMGGMFQHDRMYDPMVKAAFPNDEIITIKHARGGQPIRRWCKKWAPANRAATEKETTGDLYDQMIESTKKTLARKKAEKLDTITFLWMQGESDAKKDYYEVYARSFNGLLDQLRNDLGRKDINFIIARISDHSKRAEWEKIRKIQVDLADSDPNGAWLDTDDMNGPRDGLHYTREGYNKLGAAFATQAIKMIKGDKTKKPGVAANAPDKTAGSPNGDDGKAPMHIYLLIGQSNMAGRAPFTKAEAAPIPRCSLLNKEGKWEPARNPLNRYSTIRKGLGMQKMNPGYRFAQTMLKKQPGVSIGLVVNAKGGTSINQWVKGSRFYKDALARTKIAQKAGVLKGILWHQGESDSKNPAKYLDKLKALVTDLRKDLDAPNIPFIAGEVRDVKPINEQIRQLPKAVEHTAFVSAEGLKTMDRWHFDAASMKLLGQRYAEEMLKLHAKQDAESKKTK